jgi:hypothetical protein
MAERGTGAPTTCPQNGLRLTGRRAPTSGRKAAAYAVPASHVRTGVTILVAVAQDSAARTWCSKG